MDKEFHKVYDFKKKSVYRPYVLGQNFNIQKIIFDYQMIDFSESKNSWRSIFLGLLSPHAITYQKYMKNTIESIKH